MTPDEQAQALGIDFTSKPGGVLAYSGSAHRHRTIPKNACDVCAYLSAKAQAKTRMLRWQNSFSRTRRITKPKSDPRDPPQNSESSR